ncbi:phosphatidate cytidylyltransferase, mitochondrial-like [Glandiceps talaboti]
MSLAFAYGSAVFQQKGYNQKANKMIDFVFAVDNPCKWHQQNFENNKEHYSFLRYFGAKRITTIQEKFGAGVYYNTLVKMDDQLMKYGVVSTKALQEDLMQWKTLYLSGRLHKPVMILKHKPSRLLQHALLSNLEGAVDVALLMLPESFTEEQLYTTIAGLSYLGDFRMTVGEDRNKVSNIVKPNLDHFHDLYSPILTTMDSIEWNKENTIIEQDRSPKQILSLMFKLPKNLQTTIVKNISERNEDIEEIFQKLAYSGTYKDAVVEGVQTIVNTSSWSQSLKTILTAGAVKSIKYSSEKLKKMWKGWKSK